MSCKSILLPLLMGRVGVRRIKSATYIHLIPAFSLKGEGAVTCVETAMHDKFAWSRFALARRVRGRDSHA
jgi:hypothetical protein